MAKPTRRLWHDERQSGPAFLYNDVRNKLVFTRSRTLNPLEKLLYGGLVGARLWISTVLRTDDRRTLPGGIS